jgi:hypothetical protein
MLSTRYSCEILMEVNVLAILAKNTQMSNFIKIRSVRAQLFHADGQIDMIK